MLLSLAAVSAAVAGKVMVRVDGAWTREWVTLYAALLADPGERKSPVFRLMTEPMREWEADRAREVAPRRAAAQEVAEIAEKRLKAAKEAAAKGKGTMEEVEAGRLELEDAHAKIPPLPELLAHDATPEALTEQMAQQGGRVAVLSPEGGPFQILDGRYSDGAARLEELAQAYDGETLHPRRISRDTLPVRSPALTLAVCLQPSVLETIRNGRSLRGQGIYGRISWCKPRSWMGERTDSSEAPELDEAARTAYRDTLRTLLELEPAGYEDDGITPRPHTLELSAEAQEWKRAYHYEVEAELAPGGSLAGISDWASKSVGRAVRLAALLHVASRAGSVTSVNADAVVDEPITGECMEAAVYLSRHLTTHARAVYGTMELDSRTADLRYVLRRVRELPEGSTYRDLLRACQGRATIAGDEDLGDLVAELEERGCIRLEDHPSTGGRPPSPTIEVHPSLCTRSDKSDKSPGEEVDRPPSVTSVNVHAEDSNEYEGAERAALGKPDTDPLREVAADV